MNVIELINLIHEHGWSSGIVILILSLTVIQISPLKINPWGSLHKFIVYMLNGEVLKRISELDLKVDKLQKQVDRDEAKREESEARIARIRILRFNDELLHNQKHTKAMFDQILIDIDEYDDYCKEHTEFKNSVTTMATDNIRKVYRKCTEEHSFLS